MSNKINLGLLTNDVENQILRDFLHELNTEPGLSVIEFDYDQVDESKSDCQILITELKKIDFKNTDWVIAALSKRENQFYHLLIKKVAFSKTNDLKINENSTLGASGNRIASIIKSIRPDCKVKDLGKTFLQAEIENFDGVILDNLSFKNINLDIDAYEKMSLHPSEFTPEAGEGVFALLCKKEDVELRKQISKFHNAEVASCTNVERTILKTLQSNYENEIGIYCTKDLNGNYHVHVSLVDNTSNEVLNYKYSQSTTYQLAEKVIDIIIKK